MSEKKADESLNVFDLIDQICGDFRKQWKSGKRPRIEPYLRQAPDNAGEALFRNLLAVDLRYRQRANEVLSSRDYLQRFPEFRRVIGDAFLESTSMSHDELQSTPGDESKDLPITIDVPIHTCVGDYELVGELGRGGFGVVYEAKHVRQGNRVALKTLPTGLNEQDLNAERLHRFRKEFRSLSEINHPNLVGMQSLEFDSGQWFFTMDLVEGIDFLSYVRPDGALHEAKLRNALSQLVRGIVALHEERILHRDLKPSNVLVSESGRVTILDFGLVAHLEQGNSQTASLQTRNFAGTPRYAAPEQLFGHRSPAADWYAVGTMLFEALTGRAPYQGTNAELLVTKQNEDPPCLTMQKDLPRDLAELADVLLKRDPQERPGADVIADTLNVEFELTTHVSRESVDEQLDAGEPTIGGADAILIGREAQLEQLESAKQTLLETRKHAVVWITGLSGEGKSTLVEKFLHPIRRSKRIVVLSGRCYDRESVPFKVVDSQIDALVHFLRSLSDEKLNRILPSGIDMLAHLFPLLQRVDSIKEKCKRGISFVNERQVRNVAFAALRELLCAIGRDRVIVVFVDDLQWGDADSADALVTMLSSPEPPPLLLLGSMRSDEMDDCPFWEKWHQRVAEINQPIEQQRVQVEPLTEAQCQLFLESRLGTAIESTIAHTHELYVNTKGNPYFLDQLSEGFDAESGELNPLPLSNIIEKRLSRCPDNSRTLLQAIAVSGKACSIAEIAEAAGENGATISTLTHMRSERLVRLIGADEQPWVDTYHDKIRETVVAHMSVESRSELHLRLAEILERKSGLDSTDLLSEVENIQHASERSSINSERLYDLAYHFARAKDHRAFTYQLVAGLEAAAAYAVREAQEYLQHAANICPENAPDRVKYLLWYQLAQAYMRLREQDQALACFELAKTAAETDLERAWVHSGMGSVFHSRSDLESAVENHDTALKLIGRPRPKTLLRRATRTLSDLTRLVLIPERWLVATDPYKRKVAELETSVFSNMNLYVQDLDTPIDFVLLLVWTSRSALRAGGKQNLATSATASVAWNVFLGFEKRGRRYLVKSERLAEELKDLEVRINANGWVAAIKLASDLPAAVQGLRECQHLANLVGGAAWRKGNSYNQRQVAGDALSTSEEVAAAQDMIRVASEDRDPRGFCWGYYSLAHAEARAGRLENAAASITTAKAYLEGRSYTLCKPVFEGMRGYVQLQCSQYECARRHLEESWAIVTKHRSYFPFTVPTLALLIESVAQTNWLDRGDRAQCKTLRKLVTASRLLNLLSPFSRAHFLRVRGRAFVVLNKRAKAIKSLERAVQVASKAGAKVEYARALLDLAAVRDEGRDENRTEAIELLKTLETVIPRAESWLLGNQYDEEVVAPEFDFHAWEREYGQNVSAPLG